VGGVGSTELLNAVGDVAPEQFLIRNEDADKPLNDAILNGDLKIVKMIVQIFIDRDFRIESAGDVLYESNVNVLVCE